MYLLPVKTEIGRFVTDAKKNNIQEITDLLLFWLMLEIFGGKV